MRKTFLVAACATFALAVAAQAHENHQHSTNPLVDARQGGMTMMVANMGALGRAAEAEEREAIGKAAENPDLRLLRFLGRHRPTEAIKEGRIPPGKTPISKLSASRA